MVPLELRRADFGFGRVVVDDRGVSRERLWSSQALAWDQIRDYRLTVEIRGGAREAGSVASWLPIVLTLVDARSGYRGDHDFRFGIELFGDGPRVAFNWRFMGAAMAIGQILPRIRERLAAPVRAGFARTGIAVFGPLTLGEHAIRWDDKPVLPRAAVESVELFNSYPLRLRVMARDKVFPYGHARLAAIPNLLAALDLAADQGYPVRGRELLSRLAAPSSPAAAP